MKILCLTGWFPYPPDNGSKLREYYLLKALGRRHKVALASFAWGSATPGEAEELREVTSSIATVDEDPFATNRASPIRTFLSAEPVYVRPIPRMAELADRLCSETAFDAIISSTGTMSGYSLSARDACLAVGQPTPVLVLEEHNSMTRWMWERMSAQHSVHGRLRTWISWRKMARFESRLFSRYDLVTMVSEEDARISRRISEASATRFEVVPNGVDVHHNRPGFMRPTPGTMVYNGSLEYDANYEAMRFFVAEVFPLVRESVPDASISITGGYEGVDVTPFRRVGVRLTGNVRDIRTEVSGAEICVAPLRTGGGTRLKILEAMALGTPVVATSKGAEGIRAVPGEHILVGDSPHELSAHVVRVMSDPHLRLRLSGNARRLVESLYDWDAIGMSYAGLIEETVAAHGST
jgi:glycosyltransferase involved in cell wall biosynthesis